MQGPMPSGLDMKQEGIMTKGKIAFVVSLWEYFAISIGILALSIVTFGVFLAVHMRWMIRSFFGKTKKFVTKIIQRQFPS